ncbi:Endothelin-converting enzyme 1 [Lamellibrachia satsuma]|nr:Endothelin-converting enzyme 1 [Lamellibrachia satsuma]
MNSTATEKRGTRPMLELIKSVGSWSVTNDSVSGAFTSSTWSLEAALAKAGRYGISVLFSMAVVKDQKDNTVQRMGFDQSGLTLHYTSYTEKNHQPFIEFFTAVGKLLGGGNDTAAVAEQVWQFEHSLAEVFVKSEDRTDSGKTYHRISLAALQRIMSDIDLSAYLKETFGRKIPTTEEVLVYAPSYLTKMNNIVKVTPKVTLANYIVWHIVHGFQFVLPQSFYLAKLKFDSAMYGVHGGTPRWRSCIEQLSGTMMYAVGSLFVAEHFSSNDKKKTEDILRSIHDTFSSNFHRVAWMDHKTKARAREKARAISQMIGYPDFITNPDKLDKHYENFTFLENDTFENEVRSSLYSREMNLKELGKTPDHNEWHMGPATVNAYYTPSHNSITFPAGILQKPFYDPTFPMAVNFGSIGSIMGHELTHAFDNSGRLFDKVGNMKGWWTEKSSKAFDEQTQCMINQYGNYTVRGKHLSGKVTLAENIADNGGLKTSYEAYMSWLQKHDDSHANLPALNMTKQQLFFLSFAQIWCAYYTPEYALLSLDTDPHSYTKYRVIGTLSNTPQFAKAFSCPANSKMNPAHRCTIW